MVNLLPLALVTVAAVEMLGDAHQIGSFDEQTQGFASGRVVEVAHHDDARGGTLVCYRIDSLD